jgi:hypothetical protein
MWQIYSNPDPHGVEKSTSIKMVFLIVVSPYLKGYGFMNATTENFYINSNFFGAVALKNIFLYKQYTGKNGFPLLWPLPIPRVHDFNKLDSALRQKTFG